MKSSLKLHRCWLCLAVFAGASSVHGLHLVDESESGALLRFQPRADGAVEIHINSRLAGDYPGFAIEQESPLEVRFVVMDAPPFAAPAALIATATWQLLNLEPDAGGLAFRVRHAGGRTVVRLWDGDVQDSAGGGGAGRAALKSSGGCAEVCYVPTNAFCYDFERIRCHVNSAAREPHARLRILGWTRPCPGVVDLHRPREVYRLRVTDESVPVETKTRIVLTSRVHGGERLASFIVEGIIDYALGREVEGSSGLLPRVPPRPADLLQKLDLLIYPCLNPDGSLDRNGDGAADYDRYKCGIDMNRRWGTRAEVDEAYEVHLVHRDILAEARLHPIRYHRDFHGWARSNQGGIRHGEGVWPDAEGFEAISVTREYIDLEESILLAEEDVIPYRLVDNYLVGTPSDPPTPGTARFSLFRELAETGLISNTSETGWVVENRQVISDPEYLTGDDLRLEGAWLLLAWYHALPRVAAAPYRFLRGDANADGSVNVSDMVLILSHLFRGAEVGCLEPADLDLDGFISLTDAVYLIQFAFLGGTPPPPPYPSCGPTTVNPGGCTTPPSSCL